MKVSFLEPAEKELQETIDYYQEQRQGLGDEFLVEILLTLEHIEMHPQAWPQLSKRTRRCRTRRFPYGVVYRLQDDGILVVAVSHLHRKPLYWLNRLTD
ncbi:type II toxin-antitoxin system RelE/ParE family toxin [Crenothrix polyspora]|uniref:Plasmid stabilization system n=1 Tax=Crenothrix polyspora TaxID=360316 RepID=A0A1R4HIY3_9GAMM|nr:type II toxin-antitoxin system RelE/ParE family toxin [Crenothrix polyspora]SJM96198.1 conserved hypothetical protein [Crenothrix polyspora]